MKFHNITAFSDPHQLLTVPEAFAFSGRFPPLRCAEIPEAPRFAHAGGGKFEAFWGYDLEAYGTIPKFVSIHESLYGVKPFADEAREDVFADLGKAMSACKNFHKEASGCPRVERGGARATNE
jgi:hypothetical protein